MAQFKVYRNLRPSKKEVPFLLDVQSDLVETGTRLVIPLVLKQHYGAVYTRLNPEFTIQKLKVIAASPDLAGISERELREPVADLAAHRSEIVSAIDFLLSGY